MKLKVCGMKSPANIVETARLLPDFMGFVFWEKSPRHFVGNLPEIDGSIKKVGVFVDASEAEIRSKIARYKLDLIQLHGSETAAFCAKFGGGNIEVVKAFQIDERFEFEALDAYEPVCDYFLFDAKGKNPGGNGTAFNWNLLKKYSGNKPVLLSGGISPDSGAALRQLDFPVFAVDINSRFEIEPGLKNVDKIELFKTQIK